MIVHINAAPAGEVHPGELPPHRVLRSCVAVHGFPRCMGAATMGEERCTCGDTLSPEDHARCLADARAAHAARCGQMCQDCAFRKGSPEQEQLAKIAAQTEPFRCHQGMPVDARRGTPVKDAYAPGAHASEYPICAGWQLAQRKRAKP